MFFFFCFFLAQYDQSPHGTLWVAKGPKRLHVDSEDCAETFL